MDEENHPDEVIVPQHEKPIAQNNHARPIPPRPMQPPSRPLSRSHSAGNQQRAPQTPANPPRPRPGPQNFQNQAALRSQQMNQARQNGAAGSVPPHNSSGPHQTPPPPLAAGQRASGAQSESVGFFSARAVKQITGTKEGEAPNIPTAPLGGQAFNPHAESPSIRKTPGIDHSRTKPVARDGKHAPGIIRSEEDDDETGTVAANGASKIGQGAMIGASQQGPLSSQRGNIVNPHFNQARRIGAPTGPSSPLANRGQYRPPTVKRPALTEVSSNGTTNGAVGGGGGGPAIGGDPKRQKMA